MFRRIRTQSVYFIRRALGVFLTATHARDPRAFARQPDRDRTSNPPPRSGYDCVLIFESHQRNAACCAETVNTTSDSVVVRLIKRETCRAQNRMIRASAIRGCVPDGMALPSAGQNGAQRLEQLLRVVRLSEQVRHAEPFQFLSMNILTLTGRCDERK